MTHEFVALEAEAEKGWVVLVKTAGMIHPIGPRLLRGPNIDPKYLTPFHPSRREAIEARDAWEQYFKEHEKQSKPTKARKRKAGS